MKAYEKVRPCELANSGFVALPFSSGTFSGSLQLPEWRLLNLGITRILVKWYKSNMPIDLSLLFQRYADKLAKELRDRIRRKVGVDGRRYSNLKEPVRPPGRSLATRLNRTLKFQANAVVSSSTDTGMRVQGNPNSYEGALTFDDIIAFNNRGSADVNRGIDDPPLIFPTSEQELMMLDAMSAFEDDIARAVEVQTGQSLESLRQEIRIVIG